MFFMYYVKLFLIDLLSYNQQLYNNKDIAIVPQSEISCKRGTTTY